MQQPHIGVVFWKNTLALAATFGIALASQAATIGWDWKEIGCQTSTYWYDIDDSFIVLYKADKTNPFELMMLLMDPDPMKFWKTGHEMFVVEKPQGAVDDDGDYMFNNQYSTDIPEWTPADNGEYYVIFIRGLTEFGQEDAASMGSAGATQAYTLFTTVILEGDGKFGEISASLDEGFRFESQEFSTSQYLDLKVIPEPATGLLLLLGGSLVLLRRRR